MALSCSRYGAVNDRNAINGATSRARREHGKPPSPVTWPPAQARPASRPTPVSAPRAAVPGRVHDPPAHDRGCRVARGL